MCDKTIDQHAVLDM